LEKEIKLDDGQPWKKRKMSNKAQLSISAIALKRVTRKTRAVLVRN
jgi:hypothetical protein